MLTDKNACATIAVKDLAVAARFYKDKLGLEQVGGDGKEALVLKAGSTKIDVYRSQYAGTNKATAVTWSVADVEGEVLALKGKGIQFEHYDLPGMTQKGDIHVAGGMKAAWFKDPDGNILALVSE